MPDEPLEERLQELRKITHIGLGSYPCEPNSSSNGDGGGAGDDSSAPCGSNINNAEPQQPCYEWIEESQLASHYKSRTGSEEETKQQSSCRPERAKRCSGMDLVGQNAFRHSWLCAE